MAALILLNILVWTKVGGERSKILSVYFFDIGQGDAIFIETPSGKQALIDGGRNKKVISELGRAMAFGDRTIDVVLATHPDADHIGGLPEVFSRYDVSLYIEPGVESASALADLLEEKVVREGVKRLLARKGETIDFGDGAKLVILFPDRDVTHFETNDASIVAKLIYGGSSFLLTGDAGLKTESILLSLPHVVVDSDVLKAGHHGSRTSTSLPFAQAVSPEYTIISAGKDNSYGHPHKEVLDILERVGAQIKSTALSGTLHFETDGESLKLRQH